MNRWTAALLISTIVVAPTTAQSLDAHLGFSPGKVEIHRATLLVNRSGGQAYVMVYTPRQTDALLRHPSRDTTAVGYCNEQTRREIASARKRFTAAARQKFGRNIQLCLVCLKPKSTNVDPFGLWPDYHYGLQRGQDEIPSLGLTNLLWTEPGGTGYGFIIFQKMKLKPKETFFVKFP